MKSIFRPPCATLFAGAVLALAALFSSPALAQAGRCTETLQYDTKIMERNVAAQMSVFNTINASNYSQMKTNLGASFPGYFGGTFDQFNEQRNQLNSQFSQSARSQISEKLYQRVVSATGARNYALCIQAGAPLSAWVSSTGVLDNRIAVTVHNGQAGNSLMTYTVSGATPLNPPEPLSSGSDQTLFFTSPRSADFFLVINGRNAQTNASYTVPPIEMPAYVAYERKPEPREVSGTGRCGAGCQGNTSACPIRNPASLAAPAGFTLLPDTLRQTGRTTVPGTPGINIDPPWTWTKTPNDAPVVMTGTPGACDGASPHTQGAVDYQFSVQAVRYTLVKVP